MTEKRFKLFVGNNYGVQKVDGEVIFDSIISMAEADVLVDLLNTLHEENQLLKEEKELLKNKLDRIEDILPHYLSCAEISEFRSKTVKEDIALMKCWNKRGIKND